MTLPAPCLTPDATSRAQAIRLVAFDIDGTLTDGGLYFSGSGELMKRFSVRDGFGLDLLRKAGIRIAIVTGRESDIVARRGADLSFDAVVQRSKNKHQTMIELCARFGLSLAQAAFVGDDWPDLSAMRHVGLAVAVSNASPDVQAVAHWIGTAAPGHGAGREFCEWLLAAQGHLDGLRAEFAGSTPSPTATPNATPTP